MVRFLVVYGLRPFESFTFLWLKPFNFVEGFAVLATLFLVSGLMASPFMGFLVSVAKAVSKFGLRRAKG
jgi:hypothetical protein